MREAVFRELRLVPVAVGGDDLAGPEPFDACGDRRQQFIHGPDAGEVDARAAARVVEVIVGEAWDDGLTAQIDRRRRRAGQSLDRRIGADGGEPSAADCNSLSNRELRVDRDDVTVDENRVGRRPRLCRSRDRCKRRQVQVGAELAPPIDRKSVV